jgi:hypothetical protein
VVLELEADVPRRHRELWIDDDRVEKTLSANALHKRMRRAHRVKLLPKLLAKHKRLSLESDFAFSFFLFLSSHAISELLLLEHLERSDSDSGGERVSAKGAAVLARANGEHHVARRKHRADGHEAARQRLAKNQHVGLEAFPVAREKLSRTAQTLREKEH